MDPVTTLYTVGHSRHTLPRLVDLLRAHGIALLVDVRSHPVSKWAPHFGKEALAPALAGQGIDYTFLGRELGGRPAGAEFYRSDGTLDHQRRAEAPDFKTGLARLVDLARQRPTAILCAEEDPARCHRRLLLTPPLQHAGLAVVHVRGDGRLEPEGPPRQLGLFG